MTFCKQAFLAWGQALNSLHEGRGVLAVQFRLEPGSIRVLGTERATASLLTFLILGFLAGLFSKWLDIVSSSFEHPAVILTQSDLAGRGEGGSIMLTVSVLRSVSCGR